MKFCFSCKLEKNESEFKKGNVMMKSCYNCRLSYMQNKNNSSKENKTIICKTCHERKGEESFKKDNKIFDNCYDCRVEFIKKVKHKNDIKIDNSFMNEVDNYYLLRYKLLRINLDGTSCGRLLPTMNWLKYREYDDEIRKIESKYDFIKNIYNDYSIRKISCNWYKSISSRDLDVWELSTWDEIKALEKLYFQVQCYHKFVKKR